MMTGGTTRIGAGRNARERAVSVTACDINEHMTIYKDTAHVTIYYIVIHFFL